MRKESYVKPEMDIVKSEEQSVIITSGLTVEDQNDPGKEDVDWGSMF